MVNEAFWRQEAYRVATRSKKAELAEALAIAYVEKAKGAQEVRDLREQLADAERKLADLKTVADACAAVASKHTDREAVLADIVEKCEEIVAAVSEREANEQIIEEMEEDRERMLRALGLRECDWAWRAHLY